MKWLAILFIAAGAVYILWTEVEMPSTERTSLPVEQEAEETLATLKEEVPPVQEKLDTYRERSEDDIGHLLGPPSYKAQSEYGYEWWVYDQPASSFKQVGMKEGRVVTAVFLEEGLTVEGMTIGENYSTIASRVEWKDTYPVDREGSYRFELTEQDLLERPLVQVDGEWSMQLYFDTFTKKLAGVRLIRNDILLAMQPYKVVYRGSLPTPNPLSRQGWQVVEGGMEKQILSLTNQLRTVHGVKGLRLHDEASRVAFLHSRDMNENNYFSHYSPDGNGVKERLEGIPYRQAGENIAAQYIDATAAVFGWLNSEGHRKALLHPDYTHIGIGVHQRYYTQNFLTVEE
ncbi:CAP domain-containing protein [Halobacillus litoralis]|uniref:CAP domain-containing protein n=1 Tax=Halobacillus litoralis TaxID=45668 RepID=UPI001CD215EB|nr:CAP domain-containing protein [Halobacillus litoralis]MCA0969397.1 CAP domain-containing protein [Halobacillus litoralis]